MKTIKNISVFSVGKVCAGIGFVIGFITGALTSIASATGVAAGWIAPDSVLAFVLDVTAVVVQPLVAAVVGLIIGVICGSLYNLMSLTIGGIEYDSGSAEEFGNVDPETVEQATGGQKNPGADY